MEWNEAEVKEGMGMNIYQSINLRIYLFTNAVDERTEDLDEDEDV